MWERAETRGRFYPDPSNRDDDPDDFELPYRPGSRQRDRADEAYERNAAYLANREDKSQPLNRQGIPPFEEVYLPGDKPATSE